MSNCFLLLLTFYLKGPLPVEGSSEVVETVQQEQPDESDVISPEQEEQQHQKEKQKEQVQKILANVRQNFGKINVAPEFTDEDLVPVEMPDLNISDISGSDREEDSEDEKDVQEDGVDEPADGETDVSKPTTTETGKANNSKSPRQVIRELDDKIAKYKHFLDRAKSKRFSAIRCVYSHPNFSYIFSLFCIFYLVTWLSQGCQADMSCILCCMICRLQGSGDWQSSLSLSVLFPHTKVQSLITMFLLLRAQFIFRFQQR